MNLIKLILIISLQLVAERNPVAGQHDDDLGSYSIFNESLKGLSDYPIEDLHENSKCQRMDIPFCENVDYNKTMLPNLLGHQTQQDVISEINIYHPLIKVNCSQDLKLFLCTVYAPMCFDDINDANGTKPLHLYPCRSLCESARQGCTANLKQFNSDWPPALQCDKFPIKTNGVNCVGKDDETKSPHNQEMETREDRPINGPMPSRELGFVCPKNFEVPSYSLYLNRRIYNNCAMPCEGVLLNRDNSQLVRLVTCFSAILCLASTVFTCFTFLVDMKRFKYPARPIIIIAFCQLIVALCYLVGFLTNNRISCNDPVDPPKSLPNLEMIRAITNGNKKGSCTLQFMALYFFQMSTISWWLMMTISWYMIARLKWAPEAVSSVSRYFHLFSWTIPALLTIYLSVLGNIEGDPLTGTCYVSFSNQESIRVFVIYPVLACLFVGCTLLTLGFKSLWDSRETLRREYGKQTDEHLKLITRIGLFSVAFIAFSLVFLYCHYYEQSNLNSWMHSWWSNICKNRDYSVPCPTKNSNHAPHYSTFVLKYIATMAVGTITALFMISEKTLIAYREAAEMCNYRI